MEPVSLGSLPPLLVGDEGVTRLAGASSAVLAVPDPARAFVVAGLVRLSSRRPLIIAVPTTPDAERLAADLTVLLGGGERDRPPVELFPAWETLPFERVSPNVETMGRRLRVLWRLANPDFAAERLPEVIVAPVRALVQRLAPVAAATAQPIEVRPGDQFDPDELVTRLVASGYRREYQVEHRGEIAVRGSNSTTWLDGPSLSGSTSSSDASQGSHDSMPSKTCPSASRSHCSRPHGCSPTRAAARSCTAGDAMTSRHPKISTASMSTSER